MASLNRVLLIEAYEAGASLAEIAKQFSSSFSTVRYQLIRAGVKLRTHREAARFAGPKISKKTTGRRASKSCETCHKMFMVEEWRLKRKHAVRFCSPECRNTGLTTKFVKECPVCRSSFATRPSADKIYCSVKCSGKARSEATASVIKNCSICQREFRVLFTDLDRLSTYCSKTCMGKARTKKGTVLRNCLVCGKDFTAWLSDMQNGRAIYCSKKCRGRAFSGENR
jgi:hypothetical protein